MSTAELTRPAANAAMDILSSILAIAKRQADAKKRADKTRFAFRGHDSDLQCIFDQLRANNSYSLLSVFVFSDSGPVPYSPILNESVSKLQLCGFIGRDNPDYEYVFLNPVAEEYFNSVLQDKFSAQEHQQLQLIAADFLQHVRLADA